MWCICIQSGNPAAHDFVGSRPGPHKPPKVGMCVCVCVGGGGGVGWEFREKCW